MTTMTTAAPLSRRNRVTIIGGGPAGLMAAEVISEQGIEVDLYDAMPSVGRKFLLAGVGGMNITHSEDLARFLTRYDNQTNAFIASLRGFSPQAIREWATGLGIATFVGTSGRVFPKEMKAAPLLRAWLSRLKAAGVRFHVRHKWQGWNADGKLVFAYPGGEIQIETDTLVLALGGASWSKLGSDGAWVTLLRDKHVDIRPLEPANCGFEVDWSEHVKTTCAGLPLKGIRLSVQDCQGKVQDRQGEMVITQHGLEGSLIYALSAPIRQQLKARGLAEVYLDLKPGKTAQELRSLLSMPRGGNSMSNYLRKKIGLSKQYVSLLREQLGNSQLQDIDQLVQAIKALKLTLLRPRPIDEAISTAGGIRFSELNGDYMLRQLPGVFCAGEMLDWDAPTGGYLLSACLATGRSAGKGVLNWLSSR